jgi:neurotransmitter:Na+ symporter, NSS family
MNYAQRAAGFPEVGVTYGESSGGRRASIANEDEGVLMSSDSRGVWTSKLGFVLAAAGSAVGLGNIWRFPYLTGENGGAVFVVLYVLCVFLFGVPILLAELSLGRFTERNPVGAIEAIAPRSSWKVVGYLGVVTGLGILSFYALIAGWTFGYIFKTLVGDQTTFQQFSSNPVLSIFLYIVFLLMTVGMVYGGISGGIERWSKILMPVLPVLLLLLIIYALSLPGSMKGVDFYLRPDFSEVTGRTVLVALGQAFFSLSLGMGAMITYGSYLPKRINAVSAGATVVIVDLLVALSAGLAIFPAIFATGKSPAEGPALVFIVLPEIFQMMPGGVLLGSLFFLLLTVAALTSTISLLEIPVAFLIDEKKIRRKIAVWIVGGVTLVLGIPSALSFGAADVFTNLPFWEGRSFLDLMDFTFGTIAPPLGSMLFSLFVGWRWGAFAASRELALGNPKFLGFQSRFWSLMVRYLCPAIILLVLLNVLGIF